MLNFILLNPIFELIIIFLSILNFFLLLKKYFQTFITNIQLDYNDLHESPSSIIKFKKIVITTYIVFWGALPFLIFKKNACVFYIFIILALSIEKLIKDITNNKIKNSLVDKHIYLTASFLFLFFSAKSFEIFLDNINILTPTIRDCYLCAFITAKLFLFIFFLLINFSLILDKVIEGLNKLNIKFPLKINNTVRKYNISKCFFEFSENTKPIFLIRDCLFYIVATLFSTIFVLSYLLFSKTKLLLINLGKCLLNLLYIFSENKSTIIKKITKVAIVASLSLTYFLILSENPQNVIVISPRVKQFYEYAATVIIIPTTLESIKNMQKNRVEKTFY